MDDLLKMVMRHEGLRVKPYIDTVGKYTIGYGRNLDDIGISSDEAEILCRNDIKRAESDCLHAFPWFADLTERRQWAMIDLCFNMGLTRLLTFKHFLLALSLGDYDTAADHLLDSLYAKQVKGRAVEIAGMIRGSEEV